MYVPNNVKLYGSNSDDIPILVVRYYRYTKRMFLTRTHLKSLYQPTEPCSMDETRPDTSMCIARYFKEELGCNPMILGSNAEELTCNSSSQWENAVTVAKRFESATAKQIYEMTGCLSSCERNKYHKIEGELEKKIRKNGDLKISFLMTEGSYEEREQYIIYDLDSFIADVGGFMGLLLGCSILSLYNEMEAMLRMIFRGTFKKLIKSFLN